GFIQYTDFPFDIFASHFFGSSYSVRLLSHGCPFCLYNERVVTDDRCAASACFLRPGGSLVRREATRGAGLLLRSLLVLRIKVARKDFIDEVLLFHFTVRGFKVEPLIERFVDHHTQFHHSLGLSRWLCPQRGPIDR